MGRTLSESRPCVRCGQDAGYNRLIVDRVTGTTVGELCRRCELSQFGTALEDGFYGIDGCGFCERDGHVALPVVRSEPTAVDETTIRCQSTYDVTEATVELCDEHYHAVADADPNDHLAMDRHRATL